MLGRMWFKGEERIISPIPKTIHVIVANDLLAVE